MDDKKYAVIEAVQINLELMTSVSLQALPLHQFAEASYDCM